MSRPLNSGVDLAADDGLHPQIRWVEGYRDAGLTYVQAINHRHATMVDRNFPVIAETEEYVVEDSQKPRAMLACGTEFPVLSEEEVGVIIHVHMKSQPRKHY
jgi:hypothetical protein